MALHKERTVFPVSICVTKLSGVGSDAIFLGLLRPLSFSRRDIRAWLAPNGTIMCCGPMFAALTGIEVNAMVGSNIKSIVSDPKTLEQVGGRLGALCPGKDSKGLSPLTAPCPPAYPLPLRRS